MEGRIGSSGVTAPAAARAAMRSDAIVPRQQVLETEIVVLCIAELLEQPEILRLAQTTKACLREVRGKLEALDLLPYFERLHGKAHCEDPIDAKAVSIVGRFRSLRSLVLEGVVTADGIQKICDLLPKLRLLDLSECSLTDAGLSRLPEALEMLRLGDYRKEILDSRRSIKQNLLSDARFPKIVEACPNLRSLDITIARSLTNVALTMISWAYVNLTSLNVGSAPAITDDGIRCIVNSCRQLVRVSLTEIESDYHSNLIGDYSILALVELPLTELNLFFDSIERTPPVDPSEISNISIRALARCSSLVSFSFTCKDIWDEAFSSDISEDAVVWLVTNCTKLKKLHLKCSQLTEQTIVAIASSCSFMEDLDLVFEEHDSENMEDAIRSLASGCPLLRRLSFHGYDFTPAAVHTLVTECRNLRSLEITSLDTDDAAIAYDIASCPLLHTLCLFTRQTTITESIRNVAMEWNPGRVLDYYTKHGTSDEGCSIDRVVRGLGSSRDRVKDAVDFLSFHGHLKSTVDDDHHKATGAGTRP